MTFLLYCQAEGLGLVNMVSFETNDQADVTAFHHWLSASHS